MPLNDDVLRSNRARNTAPLKYRMKYDTDRIYSFTSYDSIDIFMLAVYFP